MHYHLIGICGTAMASLAGMLQASGHHVTGSDENVYPPMSTMLESIGIQIMKGYDASHVASPDCVVVGNAISRAKNPRTSRPSCVVPGKRADLRSFARGQSEKDFAEGRW